MGWFFEDKVELVSTGKVIAVERSTGRRTSELGRIALLALAIWIFGADHGDGDPQVQPRPGVAQTTPSAQPSGPGGVLR
jgi:hypothetical protein